MTIIRTVVFSIVVFVALTEDQSALATGGANPAKDIVGTWSAPTVEPGNVQYFEKTYFPDGTSCGFFLEPTTDVRKKGLTTFRGRWKIEGNRLTSTVVSTSEPFLTLGKDIHDQVIRIDSHVMTLRGIETGDTYSQYRVLEERGRTLCKL